MANSADEAKQATRSSSSFISTTFMSSETALLLFVVLIMVGQGWVVAFQFSRARGFSPRACERTEQTVRFDRGTSTNSKACTLFPAKGKKVADLIMSSRRSDRQVLHLYLSLNSARPRVGLPSSSFSTFEA